MIGFYNRDGQCLLRNTNWALNKRLHSVLKGLISTCACMQTHQSESQGLKFHDTEVQHTQMTTAEITKTLTNGKVTVRRCPPLSISF